MNNSGERQAPAPYKVTLSDEASGRRLDKALTEALAELAKENQALLALSRSRLQALVAEGAVRHAGAAVTPAMLKSKAVPGAAFELLLPAPRPARPLPENTPLEIIHEDAHLIVLNKPAGMTVHPAPGSETGTLVNALLHHCGDSLSGIGGELRPGIVHRIDKHTSGLLVVTKSDYSHQGLASQFAAHTLERSYLALCWGVPERADPRLAHREGVSFEPGWTVINMPLGRSPHDRKKQAVRRDGRHAVTRVRIGTVYAEGGASEISCRLETGRTHQIRLHLAHIGHGLIGDPLYGGAQRSMVARLPEAARAAASNFSRQALHAATLGFTHPVSGEAMRFSAEPPEDYTYLRETLARK